jgi:hypothetical protein
MIHKFRDVLNIYRKELPDDADVLKEAEKVVAAIPPASRSKYSDDILEAALAYAPIYYGSRNCMLDLTNADWSSVRAHSTYGMLPKTVLGALHIKMSAYNSAQGVYGNEAIMEVVASRIGKQLGVNCIEYQLANALVEKDGRRFTTHVCISEDFRKGRETIDFESFYLKRRKENESALELVYRMGMAGFVHEMFAYDFIISNLDRHGCNIEVFTDDGSFASLFDNSFSLLSKIPDASIKTAKFDDNVTVNNFIGHMNLLKNLQEYVTKAPVKFNKIHRDDLFAGLSELISDARINKIWEHVRTRYEYAREIKAIL